MQKYPELLNPKEFIKLLQLYNEGKVKYDVVIVSFKYDGSNILKYGDNLLTRNLNPIPQQWMNIIKSRFPEILKSSLNFYFEFGGYRNSPAGYKNCWSSDFDYRVFDVCPLDRFDKYVDKLVRDGLRIVEFYVFDDLKRAIEFAFSKINELKNFEGVVVKLYGFQASDSSPEIRRYNSRRFVGLKIKWENKKDWNLLIDALRGKSVEVKKSVLSDEEIISCIRSVLNELKARGVDVKKVSINDVWKFIVEEAEKHNSEVPNKEKVRQLLRQIKKEFV